MAKKKSFKQALAEFMESYDEDDDEGSDDDDVITLRGPSARALLGILGGDDGGQPAGDPKPAGDGDGDPAPEPGPQRSQSRYFGAGAGD